MSSYVSAMMPVLTAGGFDDGMEPRIVKNFIAVIELAYNSLDFVIHVKLTCYRTSAITRDLISKHCRKCVCLSVAHLAGVNNLIFFALQIFNLMNSTCTLASAFYLLIPSYLHLEPDISSH